MKSVLISIRPKWCDLTVDRKKTIEIRKSKPKLQVPFKVYVYCTAGVGKNTFCAPVPHKQIMEHYAETGSMDSLNAPIGNRKVIGEFVCDKVFLWNHDVLAESTIYIEEASELSCLSEDELLKYADGYFYGWHISNLVIYDKPKPLNEFYIKCNECCENCKFWKSVRVNSEEFDMDCASKYYGHIPLSRPPQSWCYVKELRNE